MLPGASPQTSPHKRGGGQKPRERGREEARGASLAPPLWVDARWSRDFLLGQPLVWHARLSGRLRLDRVVGPTRRPACLALRGSRAAPAPPLASPHLADRQTAAALTLVLLRPSDLLLDLGNLLQDAHGRGRPGAPRHSPGSTSGLAAANCACPEAQANSVLWRRRSGLRVRAGDAERGARHHGSALWAAQLGARWDGPGRAGRAVLCWTRAKMGGNRARETEAIFGDEP